MADLLQEEWVEQLSGDKEAVILDVRTQEEIEDGYIPGALHLDIHRGQEFLDELEKLDKSKNYFVYCRTGNRSGQACGIMESLGFNCAHNLVGGFREWDGEVTY